MGGGWRAQERQKFDLVKRDAGEGRGASFRGQRDIGGDDGPRLG